MIALVVGVLGAIALITGVANPASREQFFRSYLYGYVVWVGLPIGCLGLLMLQHLTGGAWGMMIRRVLEAGTRTLPLMLILFIPIALGLKYIYVWAADPTTFSEHHVAHKASYLNANFFIIRTLIYFFIWIVLMLLLNKWSKDQDTSGNSRVEAQKMSHISGPGLIFFFISCSFASFDWTMSLDPYWGSTIFGLIFVISSALSALAFVICTMAYLATRAPLREMIGPPHFHDWGKLMLALVMVWAYFNLSQYLLIWWANLPEETKWYIGRTTNGWKWYGMILFLFHFALPFFLLLSRDLKRKWKTLVPLVIGLFFIRMVDIYWLVGPAPHASHGAHGVHEQPAFHLSYMDFAALLGFGGIWVAFFIYQLKKRSLVPVNDYRLEKAIAHAHRHGF